MKTIYAHVCQIPDGKGYQLLSLPVQDGQSDPPLSSEVLKKCGRMSCTSKGVEDFTIAQIHQLLDMTYKQTGVAGDCDQVVFLDGNKSYGKPERPVLHTRNLKPGP